MESRLTVYPRIDPAVIALVTCGSYALLGRQARWAPGRFSLLAGAPLNQHGALMCAAPHMCANPAGQPATLLNWHRHCDGHHVAGNARCCHAPVTGHRSQHVDA